MPEILGIQELEVGGLYVQGQPRQLSENLSQKRVGYVAQWFDPQYQKKKNAISKN